MKTKERALILLRTFKEIFHGADIAARPGKNNRIFKTNKYGEGFFQSIMLFESPNCAVKYIEQIIFIT